MGLSGLFSPKSGHPLADPREMRRLLAEVPRDNAFNALDALSGWLSSLDTCDLPAERLCAVLFEIEEVAYPHLTRLAREYLFGQRLSRAEEMRLWSINVAFWRRLAASYDAALVLLSANERPSYAERQCLPVLLVHLIAAYGAVLKWEHFQHGCGAPEIWRRLGNALLTSLRERCANEAVKLRDARRAVSPMQAYDQVMVFHAASLDSLRPLEIELAESLLTHFLPGFNCTPKAVHDSIYWVDLKQAHPPQRLARMPERAVHTQRFFKPDAAHEGMLTLLAQLERGEGMGTEVVLSAAYPEATLITVMRHLVTYLAPVPPMREHHRHRVRHTMTVITGLNGALAACSGKADGQLSETWQVNNVSLGGFGVMHECLPGDAVKPGALLAMQPEGGDNWLLGVVRRWHRIADGEARVGIQVLSRQPLALQLRPYPIEQPIFASISPALLLDGIDEAEVRLLTATPFSMAGRFEGMCAGRQLCFEPLALLSQTPEYALGRYRVVSLG